MRIAVMMRAMDKDAGFRALTDGLVKGMLKAAPDDEFVLIHQSDKWLDRYASYPNARSVLARVKSNFLWDQVAVPYVAWKEKADVITNPKFFAPFLSPCPVTMGLQEPSWFTRPHEYGPVTRWYQRVMIPLSIRKCAHVFPNSKFILEENRDVLKMPIEHATIQYSAASERFRPVYDRAVLEAFRRKQNLPEKFIGVVTRAVHPGTSQFFAGKSPEVAFRAFARVRDRIPHELVFIGRGVKEYLRHTEGASADFSRVRFIEFVPFEEIHLLYNVIDIFLNPCIYEGCPNTVLQAMACGRPMIVAASGGSADVGAGAAIMYQPMDVADLAEKIMTVANDEALQEQLSARSLARSQSFSWDKTATVTLKALRQVLNVWLQPALLPLAALIEIGEQISNVFA